MCLMQLFQYVGQLLPSFARTNTPEGVGVSLTLKASQQTNTGLLLACAVMATAALPALLSTVPLLSTADAPSITCMTGDMAQDVKQCKRSAL